MDPSKLLRASNDGKVSRVEYYYPLHTAEYATVILASDWLYFSRYGIKYNTYWLCNAFEWDTVEYATRHLYFPYTHEPLGECVYEENTSAKWHVPRCPTRKHCITTLSHA